MTGLLLLLMFAGGVFAPISLYDGTWLVTAAHPLAGEGKQDTIVNHCTEGTTFYSCEQVVNGKPMALIVFTSAEGSTKFNVQAVLPNGKATGRTELTVAGDHWTYRSTGQDDSGKQSFYRTENFFSGKDKIHFEQYESSDNTTWVKKNEGDEVRVR